MEKKIEKIKDESVLSDEQLEIVTGGTKYTYWSISGSGQFCTDGGEHQWIASANGNFDYCAKCNAERFKSGNSLFKK